MVSRLAELLETGATVAFATTELFEVA